MVEVAGSVDALTIGAQTQAEIDATCRGGRGATAMTFTSADIYPLAQQLHALIPQRLQRWTGEPADVTVRDHLADAFLMACDDAGLTGEQTGDAETSIHTVIIAEALAGFMTMWGCRYGNLDEEVDRAQAALVTALGGMVQEAGVYALPEGTPITVAAIAHLIGWVTVLDVEDVPQEDA
jgi:hypothetical protein